MLGVAEFGDELVAVFETNEGGDGMHIKCVTSSGMFFLLYSLFYLFFLFAFIHSYSPRVQMMAGLGETVNLFIVLTLALLLLLKLPIVAASSWLPSRLTKMEWVCV
jgi:Sec-independent protein secretion pathway component TatC